MISTKIQGFLLTLLGLYVVLKGDDWGSAYICVGIIVTSITVAAEYIKKAIEEKEEQK